MSNLCTFMPLHKHAVLQFGGFLLCKRQSTKHHVEEAVNFSRKGNTGSQACKNYTKKALCMNVYHIYNKSEDAILLDSHVLLAETPSIFRYLMPDKSTCVDLYPCPLSILPTLLNSVTKCLSYTAYMCKCVQYSA